MRIARLGALAIAISLPFAALSAASAQTVADSPLSKAAREAETQLQQTFTNLKFEDFGPSPIKGPIYQASAGGRIIYYAPDSEHLLFAAIYDRNGVNLTAMAQEASARRKLGAIDPAKALVLGPATAPTVIEFTDPDCPYCRALERFWAAKEAEGKPVRRLVFFVSGIHPDAAAKAEHILCSPDKEAAFKAIYAGAAPKDLIKCAPGAAKVKADAEVVNRIGLGGTPTIIAGGKVISGFRQDELETFLAESKTPAKAAAGGPH